MMQKIVWVNPLKPGKLEAYKAFAATNVGPRKAEFIDLLKRYGLKNAKAYYHKLGNLEFVIVMHDAEDDAPERLAHFETSANPYDQWFNAQLRDLHDFEKVPGGGASQLLFSFEPK